MDSDNKILYKEESFAIIGACMKVHRSLDFVCYDTIIIEIKAVSQIPVTFYAQLKNYLKCTKMELGMLINFGMPSLTYKRMINLKNSN